MCLIKQKKLLVLHRILTSVDLSRKSAALTLYTRTECIEKSQTPDENRGNSCKTHLHIELANFHIDWNEYSGIKSNIRVCGKTNEFKIKFRPNTRDF